MIIVYIYLYAFFQGKHFTCFMIWLIENEDQILIGITYTAGF